MLCALALRRTAPPDRARSNSLSLAERGRVAATASRPRSRRRSRAAPGTGPSAQPARILPRPAATCRAPAAPFLPPADPVASLQDAGPLPALGGRPNPLLGRVDVELLGLRHRVGGRPRPEPEAAPLSALVSSTSRGGHVAAGAARPHGEVVARRFRRSRRRGVGGELVELQGLEPWTSCMPCRRSPS